MGPTAPRWALYGQREPCYLGRDWCRMSAPANSCVKVSRVFCLTSGSFWLADLRIWVSAAIIKELWKVITHACLSVNDSYWSKDIRHFIILLQPCALVWHAIFITDPATPFQTNCSMQYAVLLPSPAKGHHRFNILGTRSSDSKI